MSDNRPDQETPPASAAWRESCKKAIIPEVIDCKCPSATIKQLIKDRATQINIHFKLQSVSNTHKDAIFSQASLPRRVWDVAVKVMDLFENAKLKGQKLNLATLTTKPEFKQQYLAPIRSLDEADQVREKKGG